MKQPRQIEWSELAGRIQSASRIVITTHARADGDAIGSAVGLARVLKQQGKMAQAMLHEPALERYAFLVESENIGIWRREESARRLEEADLLMVVDTCAAMQLGDVSEAIQGARIAKLAVDHHVTRDDIVDAIVVDESAASCAQLIERLCTEAGWLIDPATATLLYVGLATDTGWFRFSNADAAAYACASRLVDLGARPNELYERLYLQESTARMRLIGAVLSSFELLSQDRVAVVRITREMFARCGASPHMTEDIINEPQRVGSVVVCAQFVEPARGDPVRINFRSKRLVNVAAIAAKLGGGGHERAAGTKVAGAFEDVVRQVSAAVVEALECALKDRGRAGGN